MRQDGASEDGIFPRSPDFHAGDRGSNPLGDAK
jgi:hypothetical protein